jgi:hypothetical protein
MAGGFEMMTPLERQSVKVTTRFNQDRIETEIDIMGKITRGILDLREDQVRQALIELGWTPPP